MRLAEKFAHRHPSTVEKLRYFEFAHLPVPLAAVSAPCTELADKLVEYLPDGPQLTLGLQKLIEAKDCFVRAALPVAS